MDSVVYSFSVLSVSFWCSKKMAVFSVPKTPFWAPLQPLEDLNVDALAAVRSLSWQRVWLSSLPQFPLRTLAAYTEITSTKCSGLFLSSWAARKKFKPCSILYVSTLTKTSSRSEKIQQRPNEDRRSLKTLVCYCAVGSDLWETCARSEPSGAVVNFCLSQSLMGQVSTSQLCHICVHPSMQGLRIWILESRSVWCFLYFST